MRLSERRWKTATNRRQKTEVADGSSSDVSWPELDSDRQVLNT